MQKIEYEIKLNENGRPYVYLPDDYDNNQEHKFFALEITRYLLINIMNNRSSEFSFENSSKMDLCVNMLGQISDEVAEILYNNMKNAGDNSFYINKQYHIVVDDLSELHIDGNKYIFNEVIYEKRDGLKAFVVNENSIYVYNNNEWNIV